MKQERESERETVGIKPIAYVLLIVYINSIMCVFFRAVASKSRCYRISKLYTRVHTKANPFHVYIGFVVSMSVGECMRLNKIESNENK